MRCSERPSFDFVTLQEYKPLTPLVCFFDSFHRPFHLLSFDKGFISPPSKFSEISTTEAKSRARSPISEVTLLFAFLFVGFRWTHIISSLDGPISGHPNINWSCIWLARAWQFLAAASAKALESGPQLQRQSSSRSTRVLEWRGEGKGGRWEIDGLRILWILQRQND